MLHSHAEKRIMDVSQLEGLRLVHGQVDRFWQDRFAVLYDEKSKSAFVLVHEDQYGLPEMFEVKNRLARFRDQVHRVDFVLVEPSVISDVYAQKNETAITLGEQMESGHEVEAFIDRMLHDAAAQGASDIYFESKKDGQKRATYVFFRVHGQRTLWRVIPTDLAFQVGSCLYEHGKRIKDNRILYFEKDFDSLLQDGVLSDYVTSWNLNGESVFIRMSFVSYGFTDGFNISLRIFRSYCDDKFDIRSLGYSIEQIKMFDVMIAGSSGIVLVAGPLGSGRLNTLQYLAKRIYDRRGDVIKMVSVQNKDEYPMPLDFVRRTQVDCYMGTKDQYAKLLQATFHQAPDVVLASGINHLDEARAVKDLVLSGRKVLAAFYAHSALWSYVRLREIGLPWEIATMPGFISGIIYQKLLPALCPHCSIPITQAVDRIPHDVMHRVQQITDLMYDNIRIRGDGCTHCQSTGYVGQTVCAEIVLPDRMLLTKLAANDFIGAEKYWRDSAVGGRETGGVTILAHALYKMKKGILSPLDIEENISILTMDIVNTDNMISSSELSMLAGH